LGKILGLKGQDQDRGYAKIVTKISTKIEDWNGLLRVCQGQGASRSRSNRPKPSRTIQRYTNTKPFTAPSNKSENQ
jgi:hypothetical protein